MKARINAYWESFSKDARWPLAVSAALLVLIIASVWQYAAAIRQISAPIVVVYHTPKTVSPPPTLAKQHLFGRFQSPSQTPTTQLPLQLQGITWSATKTLSRAIISEPNHSPEVYKTGDALPGGVTLQHIYHDHVVLNHQGALERLDLPVPKKVTTASRYD